MGERISLKEENKSLIKYLGMIFLDVIITYKLPHDSYSIIQYIIPPIRVGNGTLYLSWSIPLVLFIIGIKGLFNHERFVDKNKFLLFIVIIIVIIPLMRWTLGFSRTNYHWLRGDELRAVDIKESDIRLSGSDDDMIINVNLKLIDYGRKENQFKIKVYLPETLRKYVGGEFYEFENYYRTHGNRNILNINEEIMFKLAGDYEHEKLFESNWHWEDIEYKLYNDKEEVKIIEHGL